ncbi:MAG: ATP-binding cassette domain-containing protein [Verrucomicrobiota bacterium]|nr:ATP-binding cassette domain-containing protein [Verrucomicrobiota bacterium]
MQTEPIEASKTIPAIPIPKQADAILQLEEVHKFYGSFHAVQGVSFSLQRGQIYGFLGPNGAGKTTTIRMILDIIRPSSGSIRILGSDSVMNVRNRVGYLPEEKGLYKKMKAWSVIAYFASLKGLSRTQARQRAYELLERYGLKDFAEKPTEALSKGMGQKVQVLASIAHEPEFVILDEPFSGLDPVNQEVMEQIIRDLAGRGSTILFSTHVMQHAERLCEKILLIARGKKLFDGTVAQAKALLGRRVFIETEESLEAVRLMPMVSAVQEVDRGGRKWELHLKDGADPQEILQKCFESGVRLRSFVLEEPTLHEVFMKLVGPEAKEASFR